MEDELDLVQQDAHQLRDQCFQIVIHRSRRIQEHLVGVRWIEKRVLGQHNLDGKIRPTIA